MEGCQTGKTATIRRLKPLEHHSTMVLKGLRVALYWNEDSKKDIAKEISQTILTVRLKPLSNITALCYRGV